MTKHDDRSKTAPMGATAEHVKKTLPPRLALLIYHRDENTVVTLTPGESIVVGRSRPADVVVPDPTVSSKHARFSFDGSRVLLEDLRSTNGTTVNGAALEPEREAVVGPGDDIRCGSAVVVLLILAPGDRRPEVLDNHERMHAALTAELDRARHFNRPVSLLLVTSRIDGEHAGRFAPQVQNELGAIDRAALLSPTILEVLLSERDAVAAEALAKRIVAACKGVAVGVVTYPVHCAGRPEALYDAARAALNVARRKGGVVVAEATLARVVDSSDAPIVASPAMKRLFAHVAKFAASSLSVVIHGETGSGKEVVARTLHDNGPRKGKPMVAVNCAALPPSLLEATLFGTEGKIATNVDARPGLFEIANGGTLFLDEVAELSDEAQKALLRVLDTKVVSRLGSPTKEIKVDVRVVAASHKDLEEMVAAGKFRQDLRYRLENELFRLPPLRERPEEILPLAKRFLERAPDNKHVDGIDDACAAALLAHHWPGNVRELKSAIERAVVVSSGPLLGVDDLPDAVRRSSNSSRRDSTGVHRLDDVEPRVSPASSEGAAAEAQGDFRSRMRAFEAQTIIDALERCGGNQAAAARSLGMPLRTLTYKLKQLGIKRVGARYVRDASSAETVDDEPEE